MKKILLSALALVALASCSKNDETSFTTTDSQVRISSTIVTRTTGNIWEKGDAIGVYMSTNATGTDYSFADLGTNVMHTNTAEDGATANFSSATPLYYPATDDVDLLAYYPHSTGTTNAGIYSVDVSDQGDQGKIDLMVESITEQSKTNDAVEMLFDHKLARIALTIEADGGLVNADLNGMTVTLSGTKATATYALTSDAIDFGEAVASDIGMLTTKSDTSVNAYVTGAEAIIIPQSVSATLTFNTADGNIFTATIPTTAFTIGQEYLYTVTIKNTGVSLSSATINGWGTGESGSLTATEYEYEYGAATISAAYVSSGQITVTIDNSAISDATTFSQTLYRKETGATDYTSTSTNGITTIAFTDVSPNTEYEIYVLTVYADGAETKSNVLYITTLQAS